MSLNISAIVGRIVREPKLNATKNGKFVVNTLLASQHNFKTNGEYGSDYIPITIWGKSAENFMSTC